MKARARKRYVLKQTTDCQDGRYNRFSTEWDSFDTVEEAEEMIRAIVKVNEVTGHIIWTHMDYLYDTVDKKTIYNRQAILTKFYDKQ